jgi:hypothetical protein
MKIGGDDPRKSKEEREREEEPDNMQNFKAIIF